MASGGSEAKTNAHGMDKQIWARLNAKFDPERAQNALNWVCEVTGEGDPTGDFGEVLRNGYLISKMILIIDPDVKKRIKKRRWKPKNTKLPFPAREQIEMFSKACKACGVRETDVFTSQDLWEQENLNNVVNTLYALNAQAVDMDCFDGPFIEDGYATAQKNERNFTEAELRASRAAVPKWATGSIATETGSRLDGAGIVKTAGNEEWVASNEVSQWAKGSIATNTGSRLDGAGIIKNAGTEDWTPSNEQSRWTQGSINNQERNTFDAHGIVKTGGVVQRGNRRK